MKICGITRDTDLGAAVAAGADFLGFVFASSPRRVSAEQAALLLASKPSRVKSVGLFMDDSAEKVGATIASVRPDLLQFHGDEPEDFCASFGLPFIKAIGMGSGHQMLGKVSKYPSAAGFIYDGHAAGAPGGSGQSFDWSLLAKDDQKTWLAGGLTPENVSRAVQLVRPWAVDVSSGVEDAPGIKNHELMSKFVSAAKSAIRQVEE